MRTTTRPEDVRIVVAPDLADRFQGEALDTVRLTADALDEAIRWEKEGRGGLTRADIETCQNRLRRAQELYAQVSEQGPPLLVTADGWAVEQTLQGCLLDAAEAVHGACESVSGRETSAAIRAALAEVETWLCHIEAVTRTDR
jgi:hypothetical protein